MSAAWHDKPTEPGLWLFWVENLRYCDGDTFTLFITPSLLATWQSYGDEAAQCFGPIPTRPKFVSPDNASGVTP